MKKVKLLIMPLIITSLFVSCGDSKKDESQNNVENVGEVVEEVAQAFGERTAAEYPISDGTKAKLDALETDYSKVTWESEYELTDGIVVSEGTYIDKNDINEDYYHLVIAFTNTTDNAVKVSVNGNVEDNTDAIVCDLVDDDIEIWSGNTVARDLELKRNIPSGNIKWNEVSVETLDREYIPYTVGLKLEQNQYGTYTLKGDIISEAHLGCDYIVGLVLDADGNIIYGNSDTGGKNVSLPVTTFNGENKDVVLFANFYNK